MESIQQLAANMLMRGEMTLTLSREELEILGGRCFDILERIRRIAADDTLDDPECFLRIEQIICELERYGIDCGTRHDFG